MCTPASSQSTAALCNCHTCAISSTKMAGLACIWHARESDDWKKVSDLHKQMVRDTGIEPVAYGKLDAAP